ncbi:MAG: hypothetical protein AAF125_08510 [Chloroflexota bacterium]
MTLSRRDFLQVFGVTTASFIAPAHIFGLQVPDSTVMGRVINPVGRHIQPDVLSLQQDQLWADSLIDILSVDGDWYRTDSGFVPIEAVQPIRPQVDRKTSSVGDYAQVTGAFSSVHAYCDLQSPQRARLGHGAVMRVVDRIDYPSTGTWLALGNSAGEQLGWAQAVAWGPLARRETRSIQATLVRDTHTLRFGDVHTQINCPNTLLRGVYRVERVAEGQSVRTRHGNIYGVPYVFQFGDSQQLYGVWWHNAFGATSEHIEVNVLIGAYLWAADELFITVV